MPDERTPRILAGFKLHSTTTRLFSIFSRGTNLTSPDTIYTGMGASQLRMPVVLEKHQP